MGPGGCLPPASLLVNSLQVTGAVGHVIAQMRGSPASRGAHGHTHNPPPRVCAHGYTQSEWGEGA